MNKSKSFLTVVILFAVLLFSAGAALADDDSRFMYFFTNSLPTNIYDLNLLSSAALKEGIKVVQGGKFSFCVGATGSAYPIVAHKQRCDFYIELNQINGSNPSPNDVSFSRWNGAPYSYTSPEGVIRRWDLLPRVIMISGESKRPISGQHFHSLFIEMSPNAKPNTEYIFTIGYTFTIGHATSGRVGNYHKRVSNIKFICVTPQEVQLVIDKPQAITIEQGGIGEAALTGKNIRSLYYKQNEVKNKGVESITFERLTSTNYRARIQLSTSAVEDSTIEIPIYALSYYGNETSTTLTVNVHTDEDHKTPIIDGSKSIEVIAGETGTATFTGQHIKNWEATNLPSFLDDVTLVVDRSNPNRAEFLVTVKDEAASVGQKGDIKIHAYNGAGRDVATPANLTVTVTAGEKYATPTIDKNESITVIQGGTAAATFTGQHTRRWEISPVTQQDLEAFKVDLDYSENPARCEVKVTAHEDAQDGTYTANIYAFNAAGQISEPKTLTIKIEKNAAHKTAVIDNDEAVSVTHGGSATAVFTGSHVRTWETDSIWPNWINGVDFDYSRNPNTARVTVTASSNAAVKAGETATLNIYAFNGVGQRSEPKKLTVTLVNDEAHEDPVIDENESLTVVQGGTARAVFTGKHVRSWGYATLPDAIKSVVMNYDTNPNRCEVLVTASSTAEVGDCEVTIYAYNAVGERVSAKLKVTVTEDTSHPDPVIDENESVTVVQGGTARAVFTGSHIRSWNYGNLPDEVKAVELKYDVNPNRCEVLVTASSNAEVGDTSITIYAYNDIGESTSADLSVTITEDTSHPDPVIDENESVTVVQGGTASAVFTGEHIRSWNYGNLPDEVKAVELKYDVNPNRCEVLVTASSTAEPGDTSITIFAYNDIGESTSATLNVTITEDTSHPDPVIDEDESVTVIAGGTASAVFTGSHVRAWNYGNLPDEVKAVELRYDVNPNRCEVLVTASSNAAAGDTSVTIFAYNEIGESTSKTLNITIVADGETHDDPVIDEDEAVTVIAGGTAKAVFTGQHVRSWAHGNLPDSVKAIELKYDVNPNRCEMLVTASSNAAAGSATVTIYAYNEIGESTTATLNITIVADGETHDDPVIDEDEAVTVIAGGTAKAVFTGQHVRSWAHGNLPDSVKAIELKYDVNPNRCEMLVTASSNAAAGSATVTIFAYNEIGESTTATLNITIVADGETHDDPVIDEDESVTVIAGGTAKAVFTGSHVRAWNYGNLPDSVKAIELNYSTNPNRCEALVTASSTAQPGDTSITIYAYNEIGESTTATLNITIVADGTTHDDPVINGNESVTVIAGGTAKAVFTGQHVRSWAYGNLPDSVKAIKLNYETNPNRCEALVTASSNAEAGNATVTIYAYNEIGEATSATLNITIVTDGTTYPDPVIDTDKTLTVVPGGTSNTVFTGQNIAVWSYGNLPDEIKAIEMRYETNPNRCEVLVTASSTATPDTSCSVAIYAYNEVGESADKTLNISIANPSSYDPESDAPAFTARPASMDIVAGGSSSLVFRAKNVNYWRHDGDLPASVKAVEFRYDPENPGDCEVIITASSTAKAGDTASLKIYAGNMYDEVEADIKITIASESASAPVINEKTAKLTVAPGRSAKTTFTGTNISTWKYGNLPDGVTAIEFVYDTSNPNTCEVTVTASILAEEGDGGDVTITAYNNVGVSADATLTVSISEDGYSGDDDSDLPSFLRKHSSGGCDMGFAGMSLLALSMMFFKSRSKK